jgi:hypothetical protein
MPRTLMFLLAGLGGLCFAADGPSPVPKDTLPAEPSLKDAPFGLPARAGR